MGGRDNPLRDAAAIVGIGQTEFAKIIDRPQSQLAAEAVVAALHNAGIEAPDFVADGNLRWDTGTLPTNTSGGGLSEAYVHGFNLVTEALRHLRGSSTSQVAGAQTCLVTSGEGVPTSALVLRAA